MLSLLSSFWSDDLKIISRWTHIACTNFGLYVENMSDTDRTKSFVGTWHYNIWNDSRRESFISSCCFIMLGTILFSEPVFTDRFDSTPKDLKNADRSHPNSVAKDTTLGVDEINTMSSKPFDHDVLLWCFLIWDTKEKKLFCNFVANQIYLRTSYESDHQHQNQPQLQPNHLKRLCPPRHTPRKLQHHAHRVHHAPNHLRQHPLHLPQLRNQKNRNHRIKVSYSTYCSKNRIY